MCLLDLVFSPINAVAMMLKPASDYLYIETAGGNSYLVSCKGEKHTLISMNIKLVSQTNFHSLQLYWGRMYFK